MRKVKCVNNNGYPNILSVGKVYDVVEYYPMLHDIYDCVHVMNDQGVISSFYICYLVNTGYNKMGDNIFIDWSTEYRNEVINNILI